MAALDLLERTSVPVLDDFPERIADATETPLACPLPARLDSNGPAAVDEARALRSAYERQRRHSTRTSVGLVADPDAIPSILAAFVRIACGALPEEAGLPSDPHCAALDVRAYYEEAALALADHVPAARAAESWFFQRTEAGRLLREVQAHLIATGQCDYLATVVPRGQE